MKLDFESAAISDKLKALLAVAGKVQKGGKQVKSEDIARARQHGASDKEIHDTVLIAAAFCMYNRYVDGLATWAPTIPLSYRENGQRLAEEVTPIPRTGCQYLVYGSGQKLGQNRWRHSAMSHIPTPEGLPGIRGLFAFRPETALH